MTLTAHASSSPGVRGPDAAAAWRGEPAVVAATAVVLVVAAGYWGWLVFTPHMVEAVEVHVRSLVGWWRLGELPYGSGEGLPFWQNPYGPLYLALAAWLPEGLHPYLTGRLLSLCAFLATLGLVALRARRLGAVRLACSLCVVLPLTAKPVLLFAPLYRVDSVALLASTAGLLLATAERLTTARVRLAALLLVLAFATKLTFIAAPAAAAFILWRLEPERGRQLMRLLAFGLPASVALMELRTGGSYLASAVVGNPPSDPLHSLDLLLRLGLSLPWLAAVSWGCWRPRSALRRRSPYALYLGFALASAALFGANPLGSWNYLMEVYVALALLTGEVLANGGGRSSPPRRLLLVQLVVALPMMGLWIAESRAEVATHAREVEAARLRIGPLVESGARVVVLDSLAGQDLLNQLGYTQPVVSTPTLESSSEVRRRVRRALESGALQAALVGRDLEECARGEPCPELGSSCESSRRAHRRSYAAAVEP